MQVGRVMGYGISGVTCAAAISVRTFLLITIITIITIATGM